MFTCNKKVTVDDTFGHRNDACPWVIHTMYDFMCEGAGTDIPMRRFDYFINRSDNFVTHAVHVHTYMDGDVLNRCM